MNRDWHFRHPTLVLRPESYKSKDLAVPTFFRA
jgi:hypothetical protein